ncbi:MAG: tryptophan 7-halogenase [Planctomycetes bacterium]|nr:tryptophan 7-halogenase [Planctomycetota bacterium]
MYDAAIIGGGPGGSTAGYVLARAGLKCVILEREKFPRFHIGESLLPLSRHLYDRLDLNQVLGGEGFTMKYGAQFVSSDGTTEKAFDFSQGTEDPYRIAWEVERDRFDQLLLDHARSKGAEVREQTTVVDVEPAEDKPCRVRVRDAAGAESTIEARWIIDASGQSSVVAHRLKLRVPHDSYRKLAVFTRFRGASRRPGRQAGNVDIVLSNGGWFWLIPLRNDLMSVGVVGNLADWKEEDSAPEEFVKRMIERTPYVKQRLGGAAMDGGVHVARNYSYSASRFLGPGYTLVGDAAAFLDPIFSTGVMLAMRSGEHAARLLAERIKGGGPVCASSMKAYQSRMSHWLKTHFRMIDAYYSPGFSQVFLNPNNILGMVDAVIELLAGNSEMGFLDRMRVRAFYAILWLNRKIGFIKDERATEAQAHHA